MSAPHGEVAEWSKAHAWKVCRRGTVSRVRIPLSPPFHKSIALFSVLWPEVSRSKMKILLMAMMIAPRIVQRTGLSPHSIQPRPAAHISAV